MSNRKITYLRKFWVLEHRDGKDENSFDYFPFNNESRALEPEYCNTNLSEEMVFPSIAKCIMKPEIPSILWMITLHFFLDTETGSS